MVSFNGLLGTGRRFEKSLSGYEVFRFPNIGEGKFLSEQQRAENLDFLLSVKQDRCERVVKKLAEFGVDAALPQSVTDHHSLSKALNDFSQKVLARVRHIDRICAPGWRDRTPEGRAVPVFSFAADLGMYCGECAAHTDLGFDWRIDDTPYTPEERMPTSGNVVLSHISSLAPSHHRLYHDVLDWTMFRVADDALAKAGKSLRHLNSFAFLDDLMDGRY